MPAIVKERMTPRRGPEAIVHGALAGARTLCARLVLLACLGVASTLASVALPAAPATASDLPISTQTCTPPSISQPFSALGDSRDYVMAPGQTPGQFDGTGWTLSNGAALIDDDSSGSSVQVLDLPSGATATSPQMCIDNSYPTARAMVRNVAGGEGIGFYVSYAGTPSWDKPKNTGQLHGKGSGWSACDPVNIQPGHSSGWEVGRFILVGKGKTSDFRLYDLYVDPYAKR